MRGSVAARRFCPRAVPGTAIAIAGTTAGLAQRCPVVCGRARRNVVPGQDAGIDSVLGDRSEQAAYNELSAPSRNMESPFGSNRNFYSGVFNVGSTACHARLPQPGVCGLAEHQQPVTQLPRLRRQPRYAAQGHGWDPGR